MTRSCRIWDQSSAITDDDHPNPAADPQWRKNRIEIISKREFEYKIFQCLNSSKNGDLTTPDHKSNTKKVPAKFYRNSSRKLSEKSSQISGFPIISFWDQSSAITDGDHPNPAADPQWRKNRIEIISRRPF